MTPFTVNDKKIDVLKKVIDTNPIYEHLNPHHKSDYINIALDEFIKCKGKVFHNIMRNEVDRLLTIIVKRKDVHS